MKEETERLYKLVARAVHLLDETEDLSDEMHYELDHVCYELSVCRDTLDEAVTFDIKDTLKYLNQMTVRLTKAMVYMEEGKGKYDDDTEEEPGDEAFPGKYWTGDDAESPEK